MSKASSCQTCGNELVRYTCDGVSSSLGCPRCSDVVRLLIQRDEKERVSSVRAELALERADSLVDADFDVTRSLFRDMVRLNPHLHPDASREVRERAAAMEPVDVAGTVRTLREAVALNPDLEDADVQQFEVLATRTEARFAIETAHPVPAALSIDTGDSCVTGLVYFIEAAGASRIKIGWTGAGDVSARIRQLQTSSPFELGLLCTMPGGMACERSLHARFAHLRVTPTTEWFHARDEIWEMLSDLIDCAQSTPPSPGCAP